MNEGLSSPRRPESSEGDITQTGQNIPMRPVLCNRHCAKPFTLVDAFNLHNNPEVGTIIFPVSKINKYTKAPDLTAGKPQIQDSNSGSLASESVCL